MERLIWITWRAFWIGLGASLVLIAQAFAPVKVTVMPRDEVKIAPAANVPPPQRTFATTFAIARPPTFDEACSVC